MSTDLLTMYFILTDDTSCTNKTDLLFFLQSNEKKNSRSPTKEYLFKWECTHGLLMLESQFVRCSKLNALKCMRQLIKWNSSFRFWDWVRFRSRFRFRCCRLGYDSQLTGVTNAPEQRRPNTKYTQVGIGEAEFFCDSI